MDMGKIFVIFLMLFSNALLGQTISIAFVDSISDLPIGYVDYRIEVNDTIRVQSSTGSEGVLKIKAEDFPARARITTNHIGYKPKNIALRELVEGNNHKIALTTKITVLEEVSLNFDREHYMVFEAGSTSKKEDVGLDFYSGYVAAIFLAPHKRLIRALVTKVRVLVSERNGALCTFRLRFYKGQGSKDLPPSSEELETITPIIGIAPVGGGWVEFDLKNEKIPMDSNGVFAAVEWLPQETPVAYNIEYRDTTQCHRIREAQNFSLAFDNGLDYKDHISWLIVPMWFGDFQWDRLPKRRNTHVIAPIIIAEVMVLEREKFKLFEK